MRFRHAVRKSDSTRFHHAVRKPPSFFRRISVPYSGTDTGAAGGWHCFSGTGGQAMLFPCVVRQSLTEWDNGGIAGDRAVPGKTGGQARMHQAETVTLFSHDGSLTVPDCEAAPDGVFKNQVNPQPDAYGVLPPAP